MKRQMKCKWIFGLFTAAALLTSCSGFWELGKETIEDKSKNDDQSSTTYVVVDNTANRFPVDIYSDNERKSKVILNVEGNKKSLLIPQTPTTNSSRPYYITYKLPLPGIQIPYIPKGADGFVSLLVNKNETTTIKIKSLSAIVVNANDPLFDDVWISVKNNDANACRLTYYTSFVHPENLDKDIFEFNPGITALYKFQSDAALSQIKINDNYSLSAAITSFQKGYFYEVEFNGSTVTLKSSKLLNLSAF